MMTETLLNTLASCPESAMSHVGVDQIVALTFPSLSLLPSFHLPDVSVEILPQEERVGHLHLSMGSKAWALVDEVVVVLLLVDVDQTV